MKIIQYARLLRNFVLTGMASVFCLTISACSAETHTPSTDKGQSAVQFQIPDAPIAYFQYWSKYRDAAPRPNGWGNTSFMLDRNNHFSIYIDKKPSVTFRADGNDATRQKLQALLPKLGIGNWENAVVGKDGFDLKDTDAADGRVWSLQVSFLPDSTGKTPPSIKIAGFIRGDASSHNAGEKQLVDFFEAQRAYWQPRTPKHITSFFWSSGSGENYRYFELNRDEDNGNLEMTCKQANQETVVENVTENAMKKLQAIIKKYDIDSWHGLTAGQRNEKTALSLSVHYDTGQSVDARITQSAEDRLPPKFREAQTAVEKLFSDTLKPAMSRHTDGVFRLESFSFSVSGMAMAPTYQIKRLMTDKGYVMQLSRVMGYGRNADNVSVPFTAEDLNRLEAIIKKHDMISWDGFSGKNPPGILDGTQFSLNLKYADGRKINAYGSNNFPKGFRKAETDLMDFLTGVLDKATAKGGRKN